MKNIFKISTKLMMAAILTGLFTSVSSASLKSRTFYNADKSKSFEGTLTGYNSVDKKVRVLGKNGKDLAFSLNVLSKECQTYILENATKLVVPTSLDITFEKVKEDKQKGADGVSTSFDVTFYNRSDTTLQDLEVVYTVYYSKDTLNKGVRTTAKLTENGTFGIDELDDKYRITETTTPVYIVNKTIDGVGGG
jgi:hypothetical protein